MVTTSFMYLMVSARCFSFLAGEIAVAQCQRDGAPAADLVFLEELARLLISYCTGLAAILDALVAEPS